MAIFQSISDSSRVQDLTGQVFGRLTVLSHIGSRGGQTLWKCRCICGNEKDATSGHLLAGKTKSCGCLYRESRHTCNLIHGLSKTYHKKIWKHILERCYNPKSIGYHNYGGRGITVCKQWRTSLATFAKDMGLRPTPKHSIDRINNNGNYEPGNCRWATKKEQMRNTRVNTYITFNSTTQCLEDWAKELNINASTLCQRIYAYGWSIKKALTTPVKTYRK